MNLRSLFVVTAAALVSVDGVSIDHDQVEPMPQPEPVASSERAGVKFKPQLWIDSGCAVFPAVNAVGETSGGLKGTGGTSGCDVSLKGSQVYGRALLYKNAYAIMYAWYFPKHFWGPFPSRRHDWASVIIWIDSLDAEAPKVVALSTSKSDSKYASRAPVPTPAIVNDTTVKMRHELGMFLEPPYLVHSAISGDFQDLVMWEQLPEEAQAALSDSSNWGKAEMPLSDDQFEKRLERAYPF